MDLSKIGSALATDSPFAGKLLFEQSVPSTNTRLKELAASGAPEGTVLLAGGQTAGRGTGNRTFFSPSGEGLYLSLLLRPACSPEELLTLTGRTACAVAGGIGDACGAPCAVKWLNDIYLNGRKLCGILTEFSLSPPWVVVGIGVNLSQTAQSFEAEGLGGIATSLAAEGYSVSREELAAAILNRMDATYRRFPDGLAETAAEYRARCMTVGRRVRFLQNGLETEGLAVDVADDFTLTVQTAHGPCSVSSGTVTLL